MALKKKKQSSLNFVELIQTLLLNSFLSLMDKNMLCILRTFALGQCIELKPIVTATFLVHYPAEACDLTRLNVTVI